LVVRLAFMLGVEPPVRGRVFDTQGAGHAHFLLPSRFGVNDYGLIPFVI